MHNPEAWDAAAADYDELSHYITQPFIADVLGHLGPISQQSEVLDVATGTGYFPLKLVEQAHCTGNILATDFSSKMIALLNKKLAVQRQTAIKTAVMDAQVRLSCSSSL